MSDSDEETSARNGRKAETRNELFKCGAWTFPWLVFISLFRLAIYMNKLYQDCSAVSLYYRTDIVYCIISVFCLLIPPFVYMIYLVFSHIKREDGIKKAEVGTKVIDGLLLIPWQIKSIVEVLHFSVQRVCQRRPPSPDETMEHSLLDQKSMVLEFFEDFFAGFIQLVLQIYIMLMFFEHKGPSKIIYEEIAASGLTLLHMLLAVRQKDDGLLNTALSFIGWTLIMGSRAFIIALAASVIHAGIIGFCLLHAAIISLWLTPICWRTYSQSQLSTQKKCATSFLVFFLFGLPSLIYWPILFQLKANKRPLIFISIIIMENIGLFCIWYFMKEEKNWDSTCNTYLSITAAGTLVGFLLILMYICLKPSYTDQIVLHDMRTGNADLLGMYYDFFEVSFHLHVSAFVETNLREIRKS